MIILFDLDGTLIDSAPDIHAVASKVLASEGLVPLDLATVRGFIGRGVPHLVDQLLDAHGIKDPARAARMVDSFMCHYDSAVERTTVYPGVPQALSCLRADGHVLGICTNKPVSAARAVLTHLGLADRFAAIVGGDSCPFRKPHPEPLLMALRACGEGPGIFVGDSEIDAEAALAARLPMVLCAHGYRHVAIDQIPHAAVLSDFAQLPALIARIPVGP